MMRRSLNTGFLLILLGLFAFATFILIRPFLDYVVIGLLFTFVFFPLYERILAKVKLRPAASIITIILVTIIVLLPIFFAIWSLVQDVQDLAGDITREDVTHFLHSLDEGLARLTGFHLLGSHDAPPPGIPPPDNQTADPQNATSQATHPQDPDAANATTQQDPQGLFAAEQVIQLLEPRINQLIGDLIAATVWFLIKGFLGVFVLLFIMYYGFKDGRRFVAFIYDTLPLREAYKDRLFKETQEVIDAVFVGNILVSVVQGTLGGLGFWAFGIPNPVFWGFVMTILAILPIIGTPVVWLPAGVILIATGDTFAGVGILLYGLLIVSTVDNFLKPKIIGGRSQVHPAIVLLGVVGGIWVFGAVGFLLGPLILAIFGVLLGLFKTDFVDREEVTPPRLGRLPEPQPDPTEQSKPPSH
jgi:predicted PurR-regulated permease PerM